MRELRTQQACTILHRLKYGETQTDLADEYGVSQSYISKLQSGKIKWFENYKKRCNRQPAGKETQ